MRAYIVVGILAIAGGFAWFALRSGAPPSATGSSAVTAPASGTGKAAISAPAGPSLGGSGHPFDPTGPLPVLPDAQAIDAPSHRDIYTAQPRDAGWATRTEDELKDRVRALTLTAVQAVECRTDQCELTIAGTIAEVESTVGALEGPKGLSKLARSLLLGGPEQRDGRMTMRVYALFDRPAP